MVESMIHERKKEVKTGKDNLKIIRQVRINLHFLLTL